MKHDGNEAPGGFQRRPEPGSTLSYMGSLLSFLVRAEEAGGGLAFMVAEARKGSEPPPHLHEREHEIFYILDGEVDFFVEGVDHALETRPGGLAFLPRGRAHGMIIRTPTAKAVAVLHAPAGGHVGAEAYFDLMASGPAESMELSEVADPYSTIDADAMRKITDLAARNGVIFLSDAEVAARLPSLIACLSTNGKVIP